ncbi:MAG TPA: hypothetical protein VGF40_05810, partial [Thermoanaerobaculia bacterium]
AGAAARQTARPAAHAPRTTQNARQHAGSARPHANAARPQANDGPSHGAVKHAPRHAVMRSRATAPARPRRRA